MKRTTISLSTRLCTTVETQALLDWSAAWLPFCRSWAARRGLQPPARIVEMLQKRRFDLPSLSEMLLEPLLTIPAQGEATEEHMAYTGKLAEIAASLTYDLQQMQDVLLHIDAYNQQHFLTEARDLRRFQRAWSQLQFTRIEIVASEPMIVPLLSPHNMTLYLPHWLIETLPQTMFEPNRSFYRPRRSSLLWLLFDAIVITRNNELKTI